MLGTLGARGVAKTPFFGKVIGGELMTRGWPEDWEATRDGRSLVSGSSIPFWIIILPLIILSKDTPRLAQTSACP